MKMDLDRVPNNLSDAVAMIVSALTDGEKATVRSRGFDWRHHHYGLGIWMRNNWSLWDQDTPFYKWFKSKGIVHADDMSAIILESVVRHLRGEDVGLESQIAYHRNYWLKRNVDPDTMKEIE